MPGMDDIMRQKLINIIEKSMARTFTPEFPIKILLSKFGIITTNVEIITDI
jgi:hypothetical protein